MKDYCFGWKSSLYQNAINVAPTPSNLGNVISFAPIKQTEVKSVFLK